MFDKRVILWDSIYTVPYVDHPVLLSHFVSHDTVVLGRHRDDPGKILELGFKCACRAWISNPDTVIDLVNSWKEWMTNYGDLRKQGAQHQVENTEVMLTRHDNQGEKMQIKHPSHPVLHS